MFTGLQNILDIITKYLISWGPLGGLLIIIINSIYPILVPLGVFITFNVSAFGIYIGFIISYIGTIIGCFISFMLFKKIDNKLFTRFNEKEKVKKLKEKMKSVTIPQLAVLTALPFTPAFLVNVSAGLANLNTKKFLIGISIGKIPMILFWVFIGKSIKESLSDWKTILIIIGILVITYVISKVLTKIFKWEV
ncbi:MAG: VTT domain-containing protein [Bacilli bacterium]|nr:VTT domain-containing protein [Bacilli bacterium]